MFKPINLNIAVQSIIGMNKKKIAFNAGRNNVPGSTLCITRSEVENQLSESECLRLRPGVLLLGPHWLHPWPRPESAEPNDSHMP